MEFNIIIIITEIFIIILVLYFGKTYTFLHYLENVFLADLFIIVINLNIHQNARDKLLPHLIEKHPMIYMNMSDIIAKLAQNI